MIEARKLSKRYGDKLAVDGLLALMADGRSSRPASPGRREPIGYS